MRVLLVAMLLAAVGCGGGLPEDPCAGPCGGTAGTYSDGVIVCYDSAREAFVRGEPDDFVCSTGHRMEPPPAG